MKDISTSIQKKQPKNLYVLFFSEMWERFSYYGMRALLVLYLTTSLLKGGFELSRSQALNIYAIFTALAYLTTIFGGTLADAILGKRKAVIIGGLLIAIGNFVLAYSVNGPGFDARYDSLILGLGFLVIGTGFFKANVSTMVGELYKDNDPRRDSGFTMFYMGINLGGFLAPLISGLLGEVYGWAYGFISAGIGMVIGLIILIAFGKTLGSVGLGSVKRLKKISDGSLSDKCHDKLMLKDYVDIVVWSIGSIIVTYLFLRISDWLGKGVFNTLVILIIVASVIYMVYTIVKNTSGKTQYNRLLAILIMAVFQIVFFAGFEQAGGTFNLFAHDNTNRLVGSFNIPATWFQSINPFIIFLIAPAFSVIWIYLNKMGKNPSTPVKFALGLILVSAGFLVMFFAVNATQGNTVLVSPLWLVTVYLFHTVGEIFLSPIGLSLVTKLSPPKITSLIMGLWMASIALANYVAGVLEHLLTSVSLSLFPFLTIVSLISGILMLLLTPLIKRLMHGID
ncbi:MAG: peptide MFS transporter [Solitalea-like symbiont of Tyrophagus putrescentiae]